MNKIGIVVDSSTGLKKSEAEALGIGYAPILVEIGGQTYEAGNTITTKELAEQMTKTNGAKTAAITPAVLEEAISKQLETNEKVVVYLLSKEISSIWSNANLVVENNGWEDRVTIIGESNLTPWIRYQMPKILEMRDNGASIEEFKALSDSQNPRTAWISVKSMDALRAGGRVSGASAIIGGMLKVTPIIPLKDGALLSEETEKIRTFRKAKVQMVSHANEAIKEYKAQGRNPMIAFVSFEQTAEERQEIIDELLESIDPSIRIFEAAISEEIFAHVGKDSMGLGIVDDNGIDLESNPYITVIR